MSTFLPATSDTTVLSHCYSCKKPPSKSFPSLRSQYLSLYILDLQPVTPMTSYYHYPLIEACIKYLTFPSKDSNYHLPNTSFKPFCTAPTNTWLSTAGIRAGTTALASASRGEQGCSQAHGGLRPVTGTIGSNQEQGTHRHLQHPALHTQPATNTAPFWIKNKPTSPKQTLGTIHLESYHFSKCQKQAKHLSFKTS